MEGLMDNSSANSKQNNSNYSFANGHFYSANEYYKKTFGEKIYRLAIDAHFSCPNRDGSKGFGGCHFCSENGSGDFTPFAKLGITDISAQINNAKQLVAAKGASKYIAYFQSFTGTYAPISILESYYRTALECEDIIALSIATRPDCISEDIVNLLTSLHKEYNKKLYIELGLQTTNDMIEPYLNRCYSFSDFKAAMTLLNNADIPVIAHLILGLPTETSDTIEESVRQVSALPIHGIKLSLLHIIKGTVMHKLYENSPELFHLTDKAAYIEALAKCIQYIPRNIVIYRITGDAPKSLLVAPKFSANKKDVLNSINKYLQDNKIMQGELVQD
jgi:hypothetical protein